MELTQKEKLFLKGAKRRYRLFLVLGCALLTLCLTLACLLFAKPEWILRRIVPLESFKISAGCLGSGEHFITLKDRVSTDFERELFDELLLSKKIMLQWKAMAFGGVLVVEMIMMFWVGVFCIAISIGTKKWMNIISRISEGGK